MDHLTRSLSNGLVDAALERASEVRSHDRYLKELFDGADCRIIPVWRDKNLVAHDESAAVLRLSTRELMPAADDLLVFLGLMDGQACFALDLPPDDPRLDELARLGRFEELRAIAPLVGDRDASVLSFARGMCHWHRRHAYCGICGHATVSMRGGHVRRCSNQQCGTDHFPRTDPAIIVLVHGAEECLLGRKPEWPAGRYSTIAGFVEPGEAIEQAVVREVREETGIIVREVFYHSSQPWPFPGSVMLGFHAHAGAGRDIELIDGELEDARWVSREEVGQALKQTGPLRLPPRISIARRLIEDWHANAHAYP